MRSFASLVVKVSASWNSAPELVRPGIYEEREAIPNFSCVESSSSWSLWRRRRAGGIQEKDVRIEEDEK